MNIKDESIEDSDTSDDDYVPDKKVENLSEVDSDGDTEDDLSCVDDEEKKKAKQISKSKQCKKNKLTFTSNPESSSQSPKQLTDEEKKKIEEDIWADFMKDTDFHSRRCVNLPKNKLISTPTPVNEKSNSINKSQATVKITKVFEFAGEEVTVEREVPVHSAEARLLDKPCPQSTQSRKRNQGGLCGISGILNQLGKKPKISTLEKSKLDWDKFKKEENLEEELQSYNKGKDGYLDKQDFLQRADLRRFEIEKDIRTIERNRRMNNST